MPDAVPEQSSFICSVCGRVVERPADVVIRGAHTMHASCVPLDVPIPADEDTL